MEWNKAENIIIIFLIIINVFLGTLIYIDNRKYFISAKQEESLINVLKQNKITFYSNLVKDFTPKKRIVMVKHEFDSKKLEEAFFQNEDVSTNIEGDTTLFKSNTGELVIANSNYSSDFYYESKKTEHIYDTESINKEKLCKDLIKKLGPEFKNFALEKRFYNNDDDNQFVYYYRDKFYNYFINSNFLRIEINDTGIFKVTCEYLKPVKYSDEPKRAICSSDEALMTLVDEFKINKDDRDIIINSIELVYNLDEENKDSLFAVPYYTVYVLNFENPYLINAFNNRIIE